MKKTYVISAFPGCGKTYFYNNNQNDYTSIDSDSSEFSWIKDIDGNNTKERNPEFPTNYINHIKENIGKVDIIFVSSHKSVRNALDENGIKYIIVYPDVELKNEWIRRFRERGSVEPFIEFISSNWENFIMVIEDGTNNKYKLCYSDSYIDAFTIRGIIAESNMYYKI